MNEETYKITDIGDQELQEIKQQIEEWKDQYQSIYITEFENGDAFIWRQLSRAEYRKAIEYHEDIYERADYVCRLCVLDPDPTEVDFNKLPYAGIPEVLTENILTESGFAGGGKVEELTAKFDQEMETLDNQMGCVIVEAFPQFTLDEVEYWSLDRTLWYFARAKWVLKNLRNMELIKEDPNGAPNGQMMQPPK